MNKEQIAFEKKITELHKYTPEHNAFEKDDAGQYKWSGITALWELWQAKAELDKQDSLEIAKEINDYLYFLADDTSLTATKDLLTKIRKHLTNKE